MKIPYTLIQFPEVKLKTRDSHKLRGYFGDFFKKHSPLLHNHLNDGTLRYAYPLVQYKVLKNIPTLVGLDEGAKLLVELFLDIQELEIDGTNFPVSTKNIKHQPIEMGVKDDLFQYRFETLWMPLNQENYKNYLTLNEDEKQNSLNRILRNNILALLKFMDDSKIEEKVLVKFIKNQETNTNFKNVKMLAFGGTFTTNVLIPNNLGLGKSVSRGFGSIIQV